MNIVLPSPADFERQVTIGQNVQKVSSRNKVETRECEPLSLQILGQSLFADCQLGLEGLKTWMKTYKIKYFKAPLYIGEYK